MTAEKPLDSQIKRTSTCRHILGTCDVVKEYKYWQKQRRCRIEIESKNQGVDGTLSCPS